MSAACEGQSDDIKKQKGCELLSCSFFDAPGKMELLAPNVTSPSYVRGMFHTMSIDGRIGWHPDYQTLLDFKK